MNSVVLNKLTKKLTQIELRNQRIAIYKKHIKARSLFKGVNGETFHIPETLVARQANFKEFVKINFEHDFSEPGVWLDSLSTLPVYKKLKSYSETTYGSAMIYRILKDNKKAIFQRRDVFKVRYDDGLTGQTPKGGLDFILLTKDFPNNKPYKGGERKFDLAIIHHEFGHTRFYRLANKMQKVSFTLEDERQAVINLENPVRMKKGLEPRYTYFNGNKTINIITGTPSKTMHTVENDDPTKLTLIGSFKAYRK